MEVRSPAELLRETEEQRGQRRHPGDRRDLGASLVALQWSLTGYLLTAAALLLVAGALADRYGRRRVLIIGLPRHARGVRGVRPRAVLRGPHRGPGRAGRGRAPWSSRAASPCSTARCGWQDRAPGIGIWAGLGSLGGLLIGPFVGGWLVDHASWRAVFLLNVPLIVGRRPGAGPGAGDASRDRRPARPSTPSGRCSPSSAWPALIDGLTSARRLGWTSPRVVAGLILGGGCLVALVPVERRVRAPMLKLSLFASRQFTAINAATVRFYGALAGAGYLLVLRCELTLGYSAAAGGRRPHPVVGGLPRRCPR